MTAVTEGWCTDGYEALARGDWAGAIDVFDDHRDEPEALEGIGTAAWWLDDADETVDSRERAYRLYRARDDALGAARVACALAWDSVLFGGARPLRADGSTVRDRCSPTSSPRRSTAGSASARPSWRFMSAMCKRR